MTETSKPDALDDALAAFVGKLHWHTDTSEATKSTVLGSLNGFVTELRLRGVGTFLKPSNGGEISRDIARERVPVAATIGKPIAPAALEDIGRVRRIGAEFEKALTEIGGQLPSAQAGGGHHMATREFSTAVTNMQTAVMWAERGILK